MAGRNLMMTRTGPGVVAVGFVFLLALSPLAARQQTPAFRAGVQTVAIYATVVDSAGRLVPDLEQKDFEIYDEGKKQEITVFKTDVQPVSVVAMLDTSGSMTASLELLKNAAEKFVIRLLPDDRGRIGSFSDKIVVSPTFTSNRDDLVRYLHEDIDYGNPTRLWDAIDVSMTALSHEQNRRVVLVFTDGDDNDSRLSLGDVMRRAQAEEYMVYAIGLQSHVLGSITKPDPGLKKIAAETGGGYFELKTTAELNSTFSRVADELHRQYVLGFSPKVLDGRLHKLDVVATRPGMTTRARKSYLADKPK
jgi:Ca-activated chloride channel family protein